MKLNSCSPNGRTRLITHGTLEDLVHYSHTAESFSSFLQWFSSNNFKEFLPNTAFEQVSLTFILLNTAKFDNVLMQELMTSRKPACPTPRPRWNKQQQWLHPRTLHQQPWQRILKPVSAPLNISKYLHWKGKTLCVQTSSNSPHTYMTYYELW